MARGDHDPRFWQILALYEQIEDLKAARLDYMARQKELREQYKAEIVRLKEELVGGPKVGKSAELFTVHQGERLVGHGRNR
jgi:hypothetical protein